MDRREKHFRRTAMKADILLAITAMLPADVYGELLGFTLSKPKPRDKAVWWARFMFKDIYGCFPQRRDQGEPKEPSFLILEWIRLRPKRNWTRKEADQKKAPLPCGG
jgi:hypothetical protein